MSSSSDIACGRRPSATAFTISGLSPALIASGSCAFHSYCCVHCRAVMMMASSISFCGITLWKRRYSPIASARSINSGLRSSATNGPNTGLPRSFVNCSTAFFCASVNLSAGISGMRSWAIAAPTGPSAIAIASNPILSLMAASSAPPSYSISLSVSRMLVGEPDWHLKHPTAKVFTSHSAREVHMRIAERLLVRLVLVSLTLASLTLARLAITTSVAAQKELARSAQIMYAKTIFFSNQTNSSAVGANALAQLKKWGKYQIVQDQKHADLIFLLSLDPYRGGGINSQNAPSGDLDDGDISSGKGPKWNQQKPTRYAYLTVIDPKTGESLWSAEHIWGGLLTGFNSV